MSILLITNKSDVTTDFVVRKLKERNLEYYRFNTEDMYSTVSFTFDFNEDRFYFYDELKNQKYELRDFTSVYFRRPLLPAFNDKDLDKGEKDFLDRESYYTLEGLYKILDDKFWISKPSDIRNAENKFFQLLIAKKIGFKIPESIATNIPSDLFSFLNNGKCIIKPVHSGRIRNASYQKIAYTSEINRPIDKEEISFSTNYIQQEIDKAFDVRVTVVGRKIFATAIDSQVLSDTKVDWRKGEHILNHTKITLPIDLQQKCLILLEKLNLQYGAIDFVVDKNGKYFFLEINPNGQWAWIEKQTGYDISGAIVTALSNE